jgi:hypothetical protein
MSSIYEQHTAAFAQVSGFVVMDGAERVATVGLKFPKDGAGRLWAYVHWVGTPMVRGSAGGYGYDKRSAAVAAAAGKLSDADATGRFHDFKAAAMKDGGWGWTRNLEKAGFTVLQAV